MPERADLPGVTGDRTRPPRILLQGYYGAGNLGDEWLLAALAGAIRARHPGAVLVARGHGGLTHLPEGVSGVASEAVLGNTDRSRAFRLTTYVAQAARQLRAADWLVFGGGTQFQDRTGVTGLALQALLCALARAAGVRVAALGVGVTGCAHGPARHLLRAIVRMSALFAVRDAQSLAAAGPRAFAGADLAFALPLAPVAPGPDLAVTLVPGALGDGMRRARLLAALAGALPGALGPGGRVRLLALQAPGATAGDGAALAELAALLPGASQPEHLAGHEASAFAGLGLVCGMRFHALVAAAQLGLPFIGIAHDPKVRALCAAHAMPVLEPEAVDQQHLAEALALARTRRPDRAVNAAMTAATHTMLDRFLALAG